MSNAVAEILRVLRECHFNDNECQETIAENAEQDSLEIVKRDLEELFTNETYNLGSVEYGSLNKMLALCYLKADKELEAVCRLIESHAVVLRQQILHRCLKTKLRESFFNTPQSYGLPFSYVKFSENNVDTLKSKLSELPKEWYMIQITAQYESPDITKYFKHTPSMMHAMHITVLPTGCNEVEPLCITLPRPDPYSPYDVCTEIEELLSNNRSVLEATYANHVLYWKMRKKQNNRMKAAIHELEHTWLREWRILCISDLLHDNEIVQDLYQMVDKLVSDCKTLPDVSERTKWLLRKIATGAGFLTREEIARAVKYVLPKHEKLAENIILSLYGKLPCIQKLQTATRKTLVLIVDEHMDCISFESMEILRNHPVTRFQSLHIAYALFKEHEGSIENGCKIIKVKRDMGTCIVNPSGNLLKMEKRMKLFIDYWLPEWKSWYNVEPTGEVFQDALMNYDILMYNGHGNGIKYLSGEQIEKLKVKSIVLLFGCSSIKLISVGGRYPPIGISNNYLIASSPCVLGMLWEVTDADIDKMTTAFISSWIPSSSVKPWSNVDIDAWCTGILKFTKNKETVKQDEQWEPEMLRAVAKAKNVCSQYMTAAAIVVRGLPVKLI